MFPCRKTIPHPHVWMSSLESAGNDLSMNKALFYVVCVSDGTHLTVIIVPDYELLLAHSDLHTKHTESFCIGLTFTFNSNRETQNNI